MRRWFIAIAFVGLAAGCAETVRCPDGQVFSGDTDTCVPVEDVDAGTDAG